VPPQREDSTVTHSTAAAARKAEALAAIAARAAHRAAAGRPFVPPTTRVAAAAAAPVAAAARPAARDRAPLTTWQGTGHGTVTTVRTVSGDAIHRAPIGSVLPIAAPSPLPEGEHAGISVRAAESFGALPVSVRDAVSAAAIRACRFGDDAGDASAVAYGAAGILATGWGSGEAVAPIGVLHPEAVTRAVNAARKDARAARFRKDARDAARVTRADESDLIRLSDAAQDTARVTVTTVRTVTRIALRMARQAGAEESIIRAIASPDFGDARTREGFAPIARAAGLPTRGRGRAASVARIDATAIRLAAAGRYAVAYVHAGKRVRTRWDAPAAAIAEAHRVANTSGFGSAGWQGEHFGAVTVTRA
jgi:hypothetical protein